MSAKILHFQYNGSTGTVEAGFRRLSRLPEKGNGAGEDVGELARVAAGEFDNRDRRNGTRRADAQPLAGEEQFLVLDRLSGMYVKWQCRLIQRGGRGIVWLSDEVLSNRLAATKLMRQGFVVFLTIDQALLRKR